jgi:hypothetical protein
LLLPEELQELTSIVAEAGLPQLAGEMMAYALAQPVPYWGDDFEGLEQKEAEKPLVRALEFLHFQLVMAETQVTEAEEIATLLQERSPTTIAFIPPPLNEERTSEDEPAKDFATLKRAEEWSTTKRVRVTRALDRIFTIIMQEESPDYGVDRKTD